MQPVLIYNNCMIICICHRVSDREIARHVRAGMGFDEIQFELGVATQCGQCEGCAREVVAQCRATCPVAAIHRQGGHLESPTAATAAAQP